MAWSLLLPSILYTFQCTLYMASIGRASAIMPMLLAGMKAMTSKAEMSSGLRVVD